MSEENDITIDIYNHFAQKYIDNTKAKENEDIVASNEKNIKVKKFLIDAFSPLGTGATIIEIGAGGGENSSFLKEEGYNIIATDASVAFVELIRKNHSNAFVFNVLTHEYTCKYDGILCWRVFVHFTIDDVMTALRKSYNALNDGGVFVFNALNRDAYNCDSEWVDFSGCYHLGNERYYQYYRHKELDKMINETGFNVLDFHLEGGDKNNKWLVYVLKK